MATQLSADARPVGFGNDMAGLGSGCGGLLWTTDMLMDGVDFESHKHTWYQIGHKAMAVNLSDCAAAAAIPVAALCAVALNDRLSMDQALELFRGARECAADFDCPIR
ncbi:MAG: AIR synthase related protein, partial [Phycisphaerae bacterium]